MRGRRLASALAVLAVLAPTAVATEVGDVVRADVSAAGPEGCVQPAPQVPCVLAYHAGPEAGPGDDEAVVVYIVARAALGVSAGAGPSHVSTAELDSLAVRHGLGPRADAADAWAHEVLPPAVTSVADVYVAQDGVHYIYPFFNNRHGTIVTYHDTLAWSPLGMYEFTNDMFAYEEARPLYLVQLHDSKQFLRLPWLYRCFAPWAVGDALCMVLLAGQANDAVIAAVPYVTLAAAAREVEAALNPTSDPNAPGRDAGLGSAWTREVPPGAPASAQEMAVERSAGPHAAAAALPEARDAAGVANGAAPPAAARDSPFAAPPVDGRTVLAVGAAAALAALAALYHRVARHRALDQATRRAIYDAIRAEPGIRVGTLAERLGLSYKTVQRHADLLAQLGWAEFTGAGQRRYFAAGAVPAPEREAHVAAASPLAQALLAHLRDHGPCEAPVLRAALGLPASTASVLLQRLARAGVVERRRAGRSFVVALAGPAVMSGASARPVAQLP